LIRTAILAAVLCAVAIGLPAQTAGASAGSGNQSSMAIWASATLGAGGVSNRTGTRLGAQAALFGSYGSWAYGYRHGGASGFFFGGAYDDALLVGWRRPVPRSTFLALVGPVRIYDESTAVGRVGIGFAAEAGANARFVGLGISTFGAWRSGLSYIAVGLTLDAGLIR
jgi:hypothetical protein